MSKPVDGGGGKGADQLVADPLAGERVVGSGEHHGDVAVPVGEGDDVDIISGFGFRAQ